MIEGIHGFLSLQIDNWWTKEHTVVFTTDTKEQTEGGHEGVTPPHWAMLDFQWIDLRITINYR